MPQRYDVLVVGAGPAGAALAGACARLGVTTGLVDPAPYRPYVNTYGMWCPEVPADLPTSVVAARSSGRAIAITDHRLGWDYAVLDSRALHAHLADGWSGVDVHTGRAVGAPAPGEVALADGMTLRATVVVDAAGRSSPLGGRQGGRGPAEQTAYGVAVPLADAAPLFDGDEAVFMDWRADHGEPGWPTFLYAVPLGDGTVLLEETSLARRPGLAMATLRRRLAARLAHHGVPVARDAWDERVHFPVDRPRHRVPGVLGFGAAAPLVHPATGFSLAASLALAPQVAAAFAAHLPAGGDRALAAAQHAVWPWAARVVHRLRRIGLEALLRMPPQEVPAFFEQFFALPERHRWTYLTARDDLPGMVSAMNCLFRQSHGRLRGRLVASGVQRPVRSNDPRPADGVMPTA